MKAVKRLFALILVLALAVSCAACHPKDEIALTIGDDDVLAAFYLCALIQADGEGQEKVTEQLTAAGESTTDVNYKKQKIDDVPYYTWVKNRAVAVCSQFVALKDKLIELDMPIDSADEQTIEMYAKYMWDSYGYSALYGGNGVSYDTFKAYYRYTYMNNKYFNSIYGKDGTNPVPESELKDTMTGNFAFANVIEASLVDSEGAALETAEITDIRTKLNALKDRLEKGESFITVYEEYNEVAEADKYANQSAEDKENGPKNPYAQIYGNEKTGDMASDNYDILKEMEIGDIKVIEAEDSNSIALVVKLDPLGDDYYLEYLNSYLLSIARQDEYDASLKAMGEALTVKEHRYALSNLKPNKIKYPN